MTEPRRINNLFGRVAVIGIDMIDPSQTLAQIFQSVKVVITSAIRLLALFLLGNKKKSWDHSKGGFLIRKGCLRLKACE